MRTGGQGRKFAFLHFYMARLDWSLEFKGLKHESWAGDLEYSLGGGNVRIGGFVSTTTTTTTTTTTDTTIIGGIVIMTGVK